MSAQNPQGKKPRQRCLWFRWTSGGEGEVDVEVKENLRVYHGDLRGGTCLVVTDDCRAGDALHWECWLLKSDLERRRRAIYAYAAGSGAAS